MNEHPEAEAVEVDPTRHDVEPMPVVMFEGNLVTLMDGALPLVNMEMTEGYPLGAHLKFEVEVRVANVRYEEGKGAQRRGQYVRKHIFATETVKLLEAFIPGELETATVGNASSSENLLEDEEVEEVTEIDIEAAPEPPVSVEGLNLTVPDANPHPIPLSGQAEDVSRRAEEYARMADRVSTWIANDDPF